MTISKINGIAVASISKINGIAVASIAKRNGIVWPGGTPGTFNSQACDADTMILSAVPTTNYGSGEQLHLGSTNGSTDKRRSLLKWDLSSIPSDAVVSLARLSLWIYLDGASNAGTWSVYRVLRNWVEAEATWNIYSTGNNWGTAGCGSDTIDKETNNIGTVAVGASEAVGTEIQITLDNSKVQEWISGALTNYGMIVIGTENAVTYYAVDSAEGITAGERPKLYIEYTS